MHYSFDSNQHLCVKCGAKSQISFCFCASLKVSIVENTWNWSIIEITGQLLPEWKASDIIGLKINEKLFQPFVAIVDSIL